MSSITTTALAAMGEALRRAIERDRERERLNRVHCWDDAGEQIFRALDMVRRATNDSAPQFTASDAAAIWRTIDKLDAQVRQHVPRPAIVASSIGRKYGTVDPAKMMDEGEEYVRRLIARINGCGFWRGAAIDLREAWRCAQRACPESLCTPERADAIWAGLEELRALLQQHLPLPPQTRRSAAAHRAKALGVAQ